MSGDITRVKDRIGLQRCRLSYASTNNLRQTSKDCGKSYATVRAWYSNGFLDPDNEEMELAQLRFLGPEMIRDMVQLSGSIVIAAQERVMATIDKATARDASRIAAEQHHIFQLASGQATERKEFVTAEEVAAKLNRLNGLQNTQSFIDAEVVEEDDAVPV